MNTTKESTVLFSPKERIDYATNSIVSQQITKKNSGNITLFAFDKGQQLSEHSAPFDAIIQIVEGTSEIHIAGQPYQVKEGEIIILPANIPHAVYAIEKFKMILIMIKD